MFCTGCPHVSSDREVFDPFDFLENLSFLLIQLRHLVALYEVTIETRTGRRDSASWPLSSLTPEHAQMPR